MKLTKKSPIIMVLALSVLGLTSQNAFGATSTTPDCTYDSGATCKIIVTDPTQVYQVTLPSFVNSFDYIVTGASGSQSGLHNLLYSGATKVVSSEATNQVGRSSGTHSIQNGQRTLFIAVGSYGAIFTGGGNPIGSSFGLDASSGSWNWGVSYGNWDGTRGGGGGAGSALYVTAGSDPTTSSTRVSASGGAGASDAKIPDRSVYLSANGGSGGGNSSTLGLGWNNTTSAVSQTWGQSGSVEITYANLLSPTITSLSSTTPVRGQSITVNGTNLTGATFTVGGVAATVTTASATAPVITVPTSAPVAAGSVVATTTGGSASTSVTVTKGTPTPVAPTATGINYGAALSTSTLSGGSASINGVTVAGSFAWTTPTAVPTAGTASYSVTFTPTDTTGFNNNTTTTSLVVGKTTPTINTTPAASAITYGQTLASSSLSGGVASVAGTFAFTAPTTAPATGTASYNVTFTPTDTSNYNTTNFNVSVTTNKATPSVTATPTAAGITYGAALSTATLSGGSASVPGTFAYVTPTAVPNAGTYSAAVRFTPTDTTNYNTVDFNINVSVAKVTPSILVLPSSGPITYGTMLRDVELLGGQTSVSGSWTWENSFVVPSTGTTTQSVIFWPEDSANYNSVYANISVTAETSELVTSPNLYKVSAYKSSLLARFTPPLGVSSQGMRYQYSLDGGDWRSGPTTWDQDFGFYQVISNLVRGQSYSVRMRVCNATGCSQPTQSISAAIPLLPETPTIKSVSSYSSSLLLNVNVPSSRVFPTKDVEYSLDGGQTWTSFGYITSPFRIAMTERFSNQSITVRTLNENGYSSPSNTVPMPIQLTVLPDAPTLKSSVTYSSSVVLNIIVPTNRVAPTKAVEYSLDGGETWTAFKYLTSPFRIDGLSRGTQYSVITRTVNQNGVSEASSPETFYLRR